MGEGSSIGGGVGRASEAGVVRLLGRFFFRGGGTKREADATELRGTVEDLSGGACCVAVGGWERRRATLMLVFTLGAGGGTDGSSEYKWEPGSARVPTFCKLFCPPGRASGDDDLPLSGEGGGEPKRESMSKSSCCSATLPSGIPRCCRNWYLFVRWALVAQREKMEGTWDARYGLQFKYKIERSPACEAKKT